MRAVLEKFKQKEFMQNLMIELIGDVIMLVFGLIVAYYFKILFIS